MSDILERCRMCGGAMRVIVPGNPTIHCCQICGHQEFSRIVVMPTEPTPEEKVLVDVYCVSRSNEFSTAEILSLKKVIPEFKSKSSSQVFKALMGKRDYFIGQMPLYASLSVIEDLSSVKLKVEIRR